ncbi:MAG: hypothetical protein DRG11_01175 [Epsilonproteobacteria bacterium]|nr:MAG: hypothetical protein DRG11_01175 [Campylobacterota bacterium]
MIENSIYLNILFVGVANSTLLTIMLFKNTTNNEKSNYILSAIIVLFTIYILIKFLHRTDFVLDYPYFLQTYKPIAFLIWPLFYFYVKSMTNPLFEFKQKEIIHIVPFVVYTLFLLPFFNSSSFEKILHLSPSIPLHYTIAIVFQTILLIIYVSLSYRLLIKHKRYIKNNFSDIKTKKLNWLKNLLILFAFVWTLAIIRFFLGIEYVGHFILPPVALSGIIYFMTYYALIQSNIFKVSNIINKKYKNSKLCDLDLEKNKHRLLKYLKKTKSYLDSNLTLQDLADELELSKQELSQTINTQLKQNFYDLINSHRIEEAKIKLTNPATQTLTILQIAFEVGFNSKSVFNTAFKKHTNTTPSKYKK